MTISLTVIPLSSYGFPFPETIETRVYISIISGINSPPRPIVKLRMRTIFLDHGSFQSVFITKTFLFCSTFFIKKTLKSVSGATSNKLYI